MGKDTRSEMIKFVGEISKYVKNKKPGFLVIVQNAVELGTSKEYLSYLDGVSQEHIWFDGSADSKGSSKEGDQAKDKEETEYYLKYLAYFKKAGLPIFTIDYALEKKNIYTTYQNSKNQGFIPFVTVRSLSGLPD